MSLAAQSGIQVREMISIYQFLLRFFFSQQGNITNEGQIRWENDHSMGIAKAPVSTFQGALQVAVLTPIATGYLNFL